MSNSTYFIEGCPTCGRRLHIRVEYLKKKVICQHCRREFVAGDPACQGANGLAVPTRCSVVQRSSSRMRLARPIPSSGSCPPFFNAPPIYQRGAPDETRIGSEDSRSFRV